MPATITSTSTTTAALPLTGPALIAHHAEHGSNGNISRADVVTAAGYQRADGRPAFTAYYEALLAAQQLGSPQAWIAAARPEAWHGPSHPNASPERLALLLITTASGTQIGASLPIEASAQGWSDAATYATAEELTNKHASTYADAAQELESDPFPLSVNIADRNGTASLFEIDADGDVTDNLADGISRCDRCGAIEDTDDGQTVQVRQRNGWQFEPEQWCGNCSDNAATRCDDCKDYYPNDDTHTTGDSNTVCSPCIEENYYTCSDCGDLCHNDTHNTVDDSDSVCDHCIERGDYHYHEGHGWSTEPPESDDDDDDDEHQGPSAGTMRRYRYHTDANDTLNHDIPDTGHTYGAELEYKGSPDNWEAIAAACHRRAILTNDSTVSGELVSAALTAGTIRRWLANTAAALTGSRNDTATGFHIHTDRRALTPWQWFTLAHYCAQHADTLETIAGRPSNQWSDLQRLPAPDWPTFARNWRSRCWPSRYAGLNFSKGPTVEWRICRATKTPARALARFGMVQRMVALGRLAPSQRPQSAEELSGWLAQDRYIQQITGWEVGNYNYRIAAQWPSVEGDQPPQPPSLSQLETLRKVWHQLEAERSLTQQLRYNARRRYRDAPAGDATYERGALALWEHYRQEMDRIHERIREARTQYEAANALAAAQ